jgi:phage protein D
MLKTTPVGPAVKNGDKDGDGSHLSHFNLRLSDKQAPEELMHDLLDCTVENSLHLPDVCTIRMHDAGFKWLDAPTFREGTRVQVEAGGEKSAELIQIFDGEVAAVEMDMAGHGVPTLMLRCYDRSHRLHRGRQSRSFVQMKDSDIVKKVGQEAGFNVRADATAQVHDWILQNNQTNWEFLNECADRNSFRLYVQGEKDLFFKPVVDKSNDSVNLEWGKNLRSFRPRTAATGQVSEVVVRGWDPHQKTPIVGRSKVPAGIPQTHESADGGNVGKTAFGEAKMVITDRPIHTQAEADALARSICDSIGGGFLEADGLCFGQPGMKPGMMVEIGNVGNRFKGKYMVTSTTHTYTPSEGYATQFAITGKKASPLLASLGGNGADNRSSNGGNVVVGVVTDNMDPKNLGRVKVKYPWLTEDHTSYWARATSPMAGGGRGLHILPEVDDEVLVVFEHGDIRRPYIIGALWNGKDQPVEGNDKAISGGKVNRRSLKSRIGHTVLLDDTDGKGEVSITTCAGHKIIVDDKNDQIQVIDKTGSNKITIKSSDNSIKLECIGNFTVDAKGKVSISGTAGVDVNTPALMNLKGSLVNIN